MGDEKTGDRETRLSNLFGRDLVAFRAGAVDVDDAAVERRGGPFSGAVVVSQAAWPATLLFAEPAKTANATSQVSANRFRIEYLPI